MPWNHALINNINTKRIHFPQIHDTLNSHIFKSYETLLRSRHRDIVLVSKLSRIRPDVTGFFSLIKHLYIDENKDKYFSLNFINESIITYTKRCRFSYQIFNPFFYFKVMCIHFHRFRKMSKMFSLPTIWSKSLPVYIKSIVLVSKISCKSKRCQVL